MQVKKTCESVARFFVLGNDRGRHDLSDLSGVDMSFSVIGSLQRESIAKRIRKKRERISSRFVSINPKNCADRVKE